jgi:hypothetical protein
MGVPDKTQLNALTKQVTAESTTLFALPASDQVDDQEPQGRCMLELAIYMFGVSMRASGRKSVLARHASQLAWIDITIAILDGFSLQFYNIYVNQL